MSDREAAPNPTDEELTLPKATVQKLINEMLPSDLTCSKETRDLIIECCVEFIHLISAEANDICEKDAKKTISPEHIVAALKELGFESYIDEVEEVLKDHKQQVKDREKKTSKFEQSGLTEEELARKQQELFDQARDRVARAQFEAGGGSGSGAPPESYE